MHVTEYILYDIYTLWPRHHKWSSHVRRTCLFLWVVSILLILIIDLIIDFFITVRANPNLVLNLIL
jgi:hypothetical protein